MEGKELKDYFTGQALAGIMVNNCDKSSDYCVQKALQIAEHMMRVRPLYDKSNPRACKPVRTLFAGNAIPSLDVELNKGSAE